jgi:glucose-6-phosphate 1-epimerase
MTDPFDPIEIARDDARAVVYPYGAHVTSWSVRGDEQLFLSGRSAFRAGAAIRGGVPVVFPQFSDTGPLPKHGIARTRPWAVVHADEGAAALALRDDAESRALWPHAFAAELSVELQGDALTVALVVENVGDASIEFTAALHTYLSVGDVGEVEIDGLEGVRYRDQSAAGAGAERVDDAGPVRFAGEVDRVYVDVPNGVTVREPGRVRVARAEGFPDVVMWNPGPAKGEALADLEPGGWRGFVCVEAAAVARPVRLAPGERWRGAQTLSVLAPVR